MKKKHFLLLSIVLLFGVFMIGCSSNENDNHQNAPSEEESTHETDEDQNEAEADDAGQANDEGELSNVITVDISSATNYPGRDDVYQAAIERFEETHPHAEVKLSTDGMYDVLLVGSDNFKQRYDQGLLLDLNPYIEKDQVDMDDIYEPLLDLHTIDGSLYAIPTYPQPLVMMYSKERFDQAGLTYPEGDWTWEEFLEIGLTLQEAINEEDFRAAVLPFDILWMEPIVFSRGGSYVSPDGETASGYLNSQETVEAIQFVRDLVQEEGISNVFTDQWRMSTAHTSFPRNSAMAMDHYNIFHDRFIDDPDIGVAPLPYFEDGVRANSVFSWSHGINANANNPDLAWEFLRELYLVENEVTEQWAKTDVVISKSLAETSDIYDPRKLVFSNELEHVQHGARYLNQNWLGAGRTDVNRALEEWIHSEEQEDLQELLDRLAERVDQRLQD